MIGLAAVVLIGLATVAALEGHAAWAWRGAVGGVLAVLGAGLAPVIGVMLVESAGAPSSYGVLAAVLGLFVSLMFSGIVGTVLGAVACLVVRERARSARHRAWVLADDPALPYPF